MHRICLPFLACAILSTPVFAASDTLDIPEGVQCRKTSNDLTLQFKPHAAASSSYDIDYQLWGMVLNKTVLFTGASTRRHMKRPKFSAGSRVTYGHKSPYRLEGNKVVFEKMKAPLKDNLELLVHEMQAVGHEVDITAMPRDAQLAYWFNLHNSVMVNELAKAYPVKEPSQFIPDGYDVTLDEAKLITLCGHRLSLRDIREKIVYPNWTDTPTVIYGFWRGDIGSVNLNTKPFETYNVRQVLAENAREFTNSFRGYRLLKGKRVISPLYRDDGSAFFDSPQLVEDHIAYFLRPDLKREFSKGAPLTYGKPHPTIADMSGGQVPRYWSSKNSYDTTEYGYASAGRMQIALQENREIQIRKGLVAGKPARGIVTIEDIPTVEFKVNWSIPPVTEVPQDSPEN